VTIRLASHKSGKAKPEANDWTASFRQHGDEQKTIAGREAHKNVFAEKQVIGCASSASLS